MLVDSSRKVLADEFRGPVQLALALQIPICIVSLLMLDGGHLAKTCGCAMLAFWLGASLIALRRPFSPTQPDFLYIRFGFVPIFLLMIGIGLLKAMLLGL